MNVISLFTGVGGFDLGLERAGHRIVAQCEADEKARAVLRRHWPDVPIYENVVTYEPTESADLVCGGFPCQDLSVAGKRAGLAGERSGLFFEAARISDLVLGDGGWVLIENVPGLLSSNGGADFGIVLSTLADLGFHDLAWRVLDSRYFGVPQRRRRVFILARRARGRRAAQVLLEPESGGGNHQAGREARKGTAPAPSGSLANALDRRQGGADDNDAQANHLVSHSLTSRGYDASEDGTGRGTPLVSPSVHTEHKGRGPLHRTGGRGGSHSSIGSAAGDEADQLPTQRADGPPPDPDRMRTAPRIPGRMDDSVTAFHVKQNPIHGNGFTPALGTTAAIGHNGRGKERPTCAYDPKPDGPRYAQMGNAVTVNVAEWLGHRLREFG
jgi:DNA (cytosine-5)-methyltransferase 1